MGVEQFSASCKLIYLLRKIKEDRRRDLTTYEATKVPDISLCVPFGPDDDFRRAKSLRLYYICIAIGHFIRCKLNVTERGIR